MAQLRCLAEMERQLERDDPELVAAIRRGEFRSRRTGPIVLAGLSVVCIVAIGLAFVFGGVGAGIATAATLSLTTLAAAIAYSRRHTHRR